MECEETADGDADVDADGEWAPVEPAQPSKKRKTHTAEEVAQEAADEQAAPEAGEQPPRMPRKRRRRSKAAVDANTPLSKQQLNQLLAWERQGKLNAEQAARLAMAKQSAATKKKSWQRQNWRGGASNSW